MSRAKKTFANGVIEPSAEWVKIAGHVEQADRLGVKTKLRPGEDLKQLVSRAEGPGQGHETVRQIGHQCLTLMHGRDDV